MKERQSPKSAVASEYPAQPSTAPSEIDALGDGKADAPTQEKLLAAMLWIDTFEPETTAAAEAKFGFKLIS